MRNTLKWVRNTIGALNKNRKLLTNVLKWCIVYNIDRKGEINMKILQGRYDISFDLLNIRVSKASKTKDKEGNITYKPLAYYSNSLGNAFNKVYEDLLKDKMSVKEELQLKEIISIIEETREEVLIELNNFDIEEIRQEFINEQIKVSEANKKRKEKDKK